VNKIILIPLVALLSGCVSLASMPPKVSEIAYLPMTTVPEPDQGKIILAVYQFGDLTGQQKPNQTFGEMSKAVTQGGSNLLIKALKDVGAGKWFRIVERESLQSILQERKLIRTTRQMTQGDKAQPLGPMLYAGAYLTGGIIGYDSNTKSAGAGARFLGIGGSTQYRHDTITVVLRLINVVTGEVELIVMTEKTILSVSMGADKFKYYDADTQLMEIEAGAAHNEPVTYAVRKTIEGAVVELVSAGEEKGLWKYKPPPIPPTPIDASEFEDTPVVDDTLTDEEILEDLIKTDNETRTSRKEEASQPAVDGSDGSATMSKEQMKLVLEAMTKDPVEKQEIPKEVFTQKLLDELECGINPHKLECLEKATNETSDTDTDTAPSGN
tara:strand:+ start:1021 stop:2169 length:1149 start_codon:yes stop_codon:yes gene_type:complete